MPSDKLFRKKNAMPAFRFNEEVALVFDDMLSRSVPFYAEIQRMIVEIAREYARPGTNITDLGCSTGTTLVNLAKNVQTRGVTFVGFDNSPAMLKKAAQKLKRHNIRRRVTLMEADIRSCPPIPRSSVVVLCLTLQFVPPKERPAVLTSLCRGLESPGALILVEKLRFPVPKIDGFFQNNYFNFKKRNGYSRLEISRKRDALDKVLVPESFDGHVKQLKRAGFATCEEFFRWYNFCGILAVKQ